MFCGIHMKNQIALLATTYDDDEMTKCRSATPQPESAHDDRKSVATRKSQMAKSQP